MLSQGQSPFSLLLLEDKKHSLLRYLMPDSPAKNSFVCAIFTEMWALQQRWHGGSLSPALSIFLPVPVKSSGAGAGRTRCGRSPTSCKATFAPPCMTHQGYALIPQLCFSLLQTEILVWGFLYMDFRHADSLKVGGIFRCVISQNRNITP